MILIDRLINLITGMGGTKDKSAAGEFASRVILDTELEAMFRDDWIAKKIVKIPAYDMVRNWRQWNADDDQVTKLEAAESRLALSQKVLKGLIWSRLYGGAALILDDGGNYQSELKPDNFREGRLKQIHVASRRRLSIPDGFEKDIRSPYFGQPAMFGVTLAQSSQIRVHPSRVIPIHGELAPDTDNQEDFWGDSILKAVYDAVQHASKSAAGFAQLVDEAKIDIVSVANLAGQLSEQQSAQRTTERWSLFALNKSMNGVGLLDKESEAHAQKQVSFDGHDRIMMAFLVIVSGAADIPATRMLGQSPNGLNATGESDLTNYYNSIEARQRTDLSVILDRIDQFLVPHALGDRPEEIWYDFRSLWTPTPVQKADVASKFATIAKTYSDAALVDPLVLRRGVESLLIESGIFPGFELALKEAGETAPDEDDILPEEETEERLQADAAPRTLYLSRPVKNADAIIRWAKAQGFKTTVPASELHVTIAFSRVPVDWLSITQAWEPEIRIEGGARLAEPLGDKGAIVLLFKSSPLEWRWKELIEAGASWDYSEYQPHITITYDGDGIDLEKVEPYQGEIVLGPERFAPVKEDWEKNIREQVAA